MFLLLFIYLIINILLLEAFNSQLKKTVLPKFWLGHSSVDSSQNSDFGGSVPGLASWDLNRAYHINNFEAVSVKFQVHLYMTSVGSRGAGLPHRNIIKKLVPFHTCTHTHTYLHTTIYVCAWIHPCWNIIKQLLNSTGDTGLPDIFFNWWHWN